MLPAKKDMAPTLEPTSSSSHVRSLEQQTRIALEWTTWAHPATSQQLLGWHCPADWPLSSGVKRMAAAQLLSINVTAESSTLKLPLVKVISSKGHIFQDAS